MSFKPLIIDAGQFKQLPSGQALDVGGWTLPTAGGTDTYQLTADGSGNAVWTAPTFGNSIPANSAANEVYVGTGVGTAAWTTDLVGLTSLTVDNITINGSVISSASGTVSFADDNIATTGIIYGVRATGGIVQLQRDDSDLSSGDTVGSYEYYTNDADGTGTCAAVTYRCVGAWTGSDNEGKLGFYTQERYSSVGTLTQRMSINNTGDIETYGGDITLSGGNITLTSGNISASSTIVGTNIPSPTADDQALSSSASGVASWNTTCLADVLAQEVPTATGAERKYALTADSASKLEIEPAPWALILDASETVYVRTTGNDTTGDGSSGSPFLTLERTMEFLDGLHIGSYWITVDIGEGVFTEANTLKFHHPFGSQVIFEGVSERITGQDTASISASGTTLGHSDLYRYDVTMVLPVGKSVSVGDYIAIRAVSGGTLPQALYGCHYVSGWVGGSRTATIQIVYRDGAPKASGTVTCTIELIKTIIAFDNKNGLEVEGTYTAGQWKGLVFQGNYSDTNTNAGQGIYSHRSGVITLGGEDVSGNALGVVGFKYGVLAQDNGLIFADHCFISKSGSRCAYVQNMGVMTLRSSIISGASGNGIGVFNGGALVATSVKVVASGGVSVMSYQGSFIDAASSYVDQNNATYSFGAYRFSAIDATGATESDGVTPVTDGNNDGSYIIGL